MEKLIGREHERLLFQKYIASNRCEFIAVYGRRRVGKTFLIRNVFQDTFNWMSSTKPFADMGMKEQKQRLGWKHSDN